MNVPFLPLRRRWRQLLLSISTVLVIIHLYIILITSDPDLMVEECHVDVDAILEHAGNSGRHQLVLVALFSFINVISGFHYFGQTFLGVAADFECVDTNVSGCVGCTRWSYDRRNVSGFLSVVEEFDWVCSEDWKPALGQSMFFFGSVVGSLAFGILADVIGRLHVLVASNMFALVGNVITALSTELYAFIAGRFLAGCATDSNFVMMYIIVLEYVKPSLRTLGLNLCIGLFYCLSCVLIPWVAVYLGDWRSLMVFVAAPHLLVPAFYLAVPESASWLISKGKVDRAIGSFQKVARINGRDVDVDVFDKLREQVVKAPRRGHESFLGLLRTRNLRRKTLILVFKSMVLTLCYDAISRNVNGFGYSPFVVFSLSSLTILPACLLILAVQDRIGRKALASGSLLTGGVFLIVSGILQASVGDRRPGAIISMAVVARLCVNVAYNSGAQYAVELIPTVVRGQGVSMIHVVGYAASFFSPQVLYTSNFWRPAPDVILGGLMAAGALACLFLPETLHRTLPVTLQDGEEFGEGEGVFEFAWCGAPTESTTALYRENSVYTVSG